jgi:GAF domain-containing protein/HAMP domain-containing protein
MNSQFSQVRLLPRLGGWYLLLLIAAAQVLALFGAVPGMLSISANIHFNGQQAQTLSLIVPILILVTLLVLLGIGWRITRNARKKLNALTGHSVRLMPDEELLAWREITSLSWRYGLASALVIYFVDILPVFLISFEKGQTDFSAFETAALNTANSVHVLLGGVVSLFGAGILAVLLIERFTLPLRLILLPKDFETQLQGRAGLLLDRKLLFLSIAMTAIAVLMVAPIGYQHTVQVLYADINSLAVFRSLQVQLLVFSVLALMFGIVFSFYISRSVSGPINDLIETFNRIEQGDLKQRAPVSATDELGIVMMQFNRMVARLESLQETLEQQVIERTRQLAATNEVGRVAASSLDPEQLLTRVTPLFHEQFGYYYAAIYLLDPSGRWAELKEATGEAGRVLKENHHRLEITGKSMVGAAIRERAPRIAQIASLEKQRFENPLLPYTRSEIALPLMIGERVLGALNVQSTKESDFGPEVIETMKNMASQVTIALENARLYQEAQQVIMEMRAVQKQYLLKGWSDFSEANNLLEYRLGDEPDEHTKRLEVPITLRDQTLGDIRLEQKEEWTAEQRSLVDAVATQAAIALENARLVSESRQIALRERMVAEINSKIWTSATIDGVLQTAIKELGRRLDASNATVELRLDGAAEDES